MKYCSNCGKPVVKKIPRGDNRYRFVCEHCELVHYQNPRIVAGCLARYEDKVLLCKRAIEPRYGFWTLPAGFMENGETSLEAAARETWEEAVAEVEIAQLYTLFNLPHINQVYMIFLARLPQPAFAAGDESLEVGLFGEAEIPWDQLAFTTVKKTLELYFEERGSGRFGTHVRDIRPKD